MESRRKQSEGPEHVSLAARRALAGIKWASKARADDASCAEREETSGGDAGARQFRKIDGERALDRGGDVLTADASFQAPAERSPSLRRV